MPVSSDVDEDGFLAPLPGFAPGAPGACGNDCDDRTPNAFPGGREVCDGRDNDCDGDVDEGFDFVPTQADPLLISEGAGEAGLGGLVHTGELFVLSYSARNERNSAFLKGLRDPSRPVFTEEISLTNSDAFAGPVRWTGRYLVTVWEDRRHDDFEIYFNRFDATANKLDPDLRLTDAPDFSLNPTLLDVGDDFLVFWQDRRLLLNDFQVYAQRVTRSGEPVGDNVNVSTEIFDAEAPNVARGLEQLALVFNAPFDGRQIVFRSISFDLSSLSNTVVISPPNSVGASVSFNRDRYLVLWHEYVDGPGDAIWGTAVDAAGNTLVPVRRVTASAQFARGHSLIPLGNRLLLLWAQFEGTSYDLFFRVLSPDLEPESDPVQLTFSAGNIVGVTGAIGDGLLGIAYTSFGSGSPQVYFTALECR